MVVLQESFSFLLKFYSYDKQVEVAEVEYPIEKGFTKIYTTTTDITFRFPNQILLSQARPNPEIRLDQYGEENGSLDFPTDTYAHSPLQPLIVKYDRPV